jgi:hypothetical protein
MYPSERFQASTKSGQKADVGREAAMNWVNLLRPLTVATTTMT